jgi:hypothetical protein
MKYKKAFLRIKSILHQPYTSTTKVEQIEQVVKETEEAKDETRTDAPECT